MSFLSLPRANYYHILNQFLIFLYVLFAAFMPADNLSIKKFLLCLVLSINLPLLLNRFIEFQPKVILFFSSIYPIYICLNSIISGGYVYETLASTYFFVSLLLVIIIITYNILYESILIFVLDVLAFTILLSVALDLTGIYDLYINKFLMYLHHTDNAMIGKSLMFTAYYIIFIKTTPLLLIPLLYYLNRRQYILSFFILLALIASGTRANIFMGIVSVFGFFLFCSKNNYFRIILVMCVTLLIAYFYNELCATIISIFQRKASSDAVRLGHWLSIKEILSDPVNLIWGMGYGVPFFSEGINTMTSQTELSYLETIRTNGIVSFIPIVIFFLLPINHLWKNNRHKLIAYISYLIIAFTNPLLLSTTSFLMYIYIYSDYYTHRNTSPQY